MKWADDFKDAWSSWYLWLVGASSTILAILSAIGTFAETLAVLSPTVSLVIVAVVALLGAFIRALPQPEKKKKIKKGL